MVLKGMRKYFEGINNSIKYAHLPGSAGEIQMSQRASKQGSCPHGRGTPCSTLRRLDGACATFAVDLYVLKFVHVDSCMLSWLALDSKHFACEVHSHWGVSILLISTCVCYCMNEYSRSPMLSSFVRFSKFCSSTFGSVLRLCRNVFEAGCPSVGLLGLQLHQQGCVVFQSDCSFISFSGELQFASVSHPGVLTLSAKPRSHPSTCRSLLHFALEVSIYNKFGSL